MKSPKHVETSGTVFLAFFWLYFRSSLIENCTVHYPTGRLLRRDDRVGGRSRNRTFGRRIEACGDGW